MKIATLIATCYLPTNLVLVSPLFKVSNCPPHNSLILLGQSFFSTSLIQYNDGKDGMTVRGQIWIAILMSVVLVGITFGGASFWYRPRRDTRNGAASVSPS